MRILYNIGTGFYYLLIRLAASWNPKASKWVSGRKGWQQKMKQAFIHTDRVVWFHCASLGEFEQGRPVIEWVHKNRPEYKILLTFFSPSGYEKRKNYPSADVVMYLPADSKRNAKRMLETVPVSYALFIKYEFWYHYLIALKRSNIPTYLISGHFRRSQVFFRWYGGWYRKMLETYDRIFVQDPSSSELLAEAGITEVKIAGDTRFDRVMQIAGERKKLPGLEKFSAGRDVLVAGSTWEEDEKILKEIYDRNENNMGFIIAPHEPVKKHLQRLREYFPQHQLYSRLDENTKTADHVIIVDTIGHLSSLYHYGTIAMIGGGFGKGIHNVLEATAAGLPVFFGPNFHDFREANELVALKCGVAVSDADQAITEIFNLLHNRNELKNRSADAANYTAEKTGATSVIVNDIFSQTQ